MLENCNKNSYVALAFTSLCCLVVKRDLVQQFLIPNIYHGEDAAVIPVWIARANKVSYIPQKYIIIFIDLIRFLLQLIEICLFRC